MASGRRHESDTVPRCRSLGNTRPLRGTKRALCALMSLAAGAAIPRTLAAYDPLAIGRDAPPSPGEFVVLDSARRREIPLRIHLPADRAAAPVVLFSHGLGGSREGSAYLGRHWSARGYVAVFLQHPGSDEGVWRDVPKAKRLAAMNEAASLPNLLLRMRDVPVVLDQLATWHRQTGHALAGRLNLDRVGMSGHSFGAVTTQAVSGQSLPGSGPRFTDARIKAALPMSPSPPRRGDPAPAFASVQIPWLLMTGTRDTSPIGGQTVESRLNVYPHLPDMAKYELVLHNAEHSAFTERPLPGESGRRNPNHHRAILALSTAFWDTHLRADPAARAWLHGAGVRAVLEPRDRWRFQVAAEGARAPGTGSGAP